MPVECLSVPLETVIQDLPGLKCPHGKEAWIAPGTLDRDPQESICWVALEMVLKCDQCTLHVWVQKMVPITISAGLWSS